MKELNPEPIVASLNGRDVDYVVIGMFAAGLASPIIGWAAAEWYKGKLLFGFVEGEWLFWLSVAHG